MKSAQSRLKYLRSCAVAALGAIASHAPAVGADTASAAFDLCVRPPPPQCVELPATYRTAAATAVCRDEIVRYVRLVMEYRGCLDREIRRANLDANRIIDQFKCSQQRQKGCP